MLVHGDLVGDAELVGVRLVAVVELRLAGVLQLMLCLELALAVVGDGRLDGVGLAVVGDAVAGVARDLAQRVGVLAGLVIGNLAHRDLAVGGVGALGDDLVALDELEGELAFLERTPGQGLGRLDLVGDTRLDRRHVIGVGERKRRIAVRVRGYAQLTFAVISHGEGNLARQLGVVGHASDLAGLGHGVGKGVLALLGLLAQSLVKAVERKGDLAKVDLAVDVVVHARVLGHRRALFTGHGKGELAGDVSRGQAVSGLQVLDARKRCLGGIRVVSVLELGLARSHLHGSAELALLVGRHRHGNLRDILAVGNAIDRGPSVLLADLVDIRARCLVFDRAEVNGRLALIRIVIGHGHSHGLSRGLGHRGVVLGRQLKLKRVLFRPGAALEHLGQAEVGLGVHRRRRHVVLIADLAVVAQVRINLRCALLG